MYHRHSRLPTEVPEADALLHKLSDDGGMTVPSCYVHRGHPKLKKNTLFYFSRKLSKNLIFNEGGRSTADEQLDHISVAALCGDVEWGRVCDSVPAHKSILARVHHMANKWRLCPAGGDNVLVKFEQFLKNTRGTSFCRNVSRCVPILK